MSPGAVARLPPWGPLSLGLQLRAWVNLGVWSPFPGSPLRAFPQEPVPPGLALSAPSGGLGSRHPTPWVRERGALLSCTQSGQGPVLPTATGLIQGWRPQTHR